MSDKYKIANKYKPYFIRAVIVGSAEMFTKPNHKSVIVESLKYRRLNKSYRTHSLQTSANGVLIFILSICIFFNANSQSQYNNQNYLSIFGKIKSYKNETITIDKIKVLQGIYDGSNITVTLSVGLIIDGKAASVNKLDSTWIGKYVLIETVYVEQFKGYYTTGKYGSWGYLQPALTPDGHTLYFLTKENNLKNGIPDSNTKILKSIQEVTKINHIIDENEKLEKINEIILNSTEYMFIREYLIWELNKIRPQKFCSEIKKSKIISSYIGNKKLPLYIRLKARDFYPKNDNYKLYYDLLYDLKHTIDQNKTGNLTYRNLNNYKSRIDIYKKFYKNELSKKNNEEKYIIELINKKINQ